MNTQQGNHSKFNVLSIISMALMLKLDDTVTSLSTILAAQNKLNLFPAWHICLAHLKQKLN